MSLGWLDIFNRWRTASKQKSLTPRVSNSIAPLQPFGTATDAYDPVLYERAMSLLSQDAWDEAAKCAEELLRCGAEGVAHRLKAHIALGRGQLDVAKNNFDAAINADADNSTLYLEAGLLALRCNEAEDAEYLLSMAVQRDDTNTAAHFALGELLSGRERAESARAYFVAALRTEPGHIQARLHLAEACRKSDELTEAIRLCREGLEITPENFELQAQLGKYYRDLGDYVSARHHAARAFELRPDDAGAVLNYAQTLLWTGEPKQAISLVQSVVDADPGSSLARWNLMSMLLQDQQFEQGWPHFEALMGKRSRSTRYGVPQKLWQGEALAGKRVLIFGEQGLGDEIMFASCFPRVIAQAATCIIECAPKLERLYTASFPRAVIHAGSAKESREWVHEHGVIDYEIPCGSLGSVFRRTLSDFSSQAYLHVLPPDTTRWRKRLNALGPGLKIGISWRGGITTTGMHARSIPLREWAPILNIPGASFVNLQYTDCTAEIQSAATEAGVSISTWQDALDDYYETAALVSALDLVVSVCTSIVFVTSGLGRPVWIMAPPGASWRYVRGQRQTPWMPAAQVYWREATPGWAPVINRVAEDLRRYIDQVGNSS